MSKHCVDVQDFKDHADEGRWRSYHLFAEGDTLEQLLDSAVYFMTDQDGGEMGEVPADDAKAQAYITKYFYAREEREHKSEQIAREKRLI
jgi:hypothetical protein